MTNLALKSELTKLLEGKVPSETIQRSSIPAMLEEYFHFSASDIEYFLYNGFDVFFVCEDELRENLQKLSSKISLSKPEMKMLVLSHPKMVLMRAEVLLYKLKLICTIFECSLSDALKLAFYIPSLLTLSKKEIIKQIEFLQIQLRGEDFSARKNLRRDPRLLFLNELMLKRIKGFLMKSLQLSEADSILAVTKCPAIAFSSESDLKNFYDYFYSLGLVKRDLKEMVNECPQVLMLKSRQIEETLKKISLSLGVDKKQALLIARKNPTLFCYTFVEDRIKSFLDLGISKQYLAVYSEIFSMPKIEVYIKLILARNLKLEKNFDQVLPLNLDKLLRRVQFMKKYSLGDIGIIFAKDQDLEEKYNLSQDEYLSDKIQTEFLMYAQSYYLKNKIEGANISSLPSLNEVVDFAISKSLLGKEQNKEKMFCYHSNTMQNLMTLGLSQEEGDLIQNLNPSASLFSDNTFMLINLFLRMGKSKSEICNMLIKNPSILSYSVKDYVQIAENQQFFI